MPGGNGQDLSVQAGLEKLGVQISAAIDRMQFGSRLGEQYRGLRNVYETLGWPTRLTWDHYHGKYLRQDIAGRIVDLPPDTTWREGFRLRDDDDPDNETAFEAAWKELERRLRVTAWLRRLDRMAGIGEYACLYLGIRGQDAGAPLRRAGPDALVYLSVFAQPNAEIAEIEGDVQDERFGLPTRYSLTVGDVSQLHLGRITPAGGSATISAHWSRILHAAEGADENPVYGRPRLQRVYNLLESLQLVAGATGEGYWRTGARGRYHLNIQPEFAGDLNMLVTNDDGQQVSLREAMGDELTKLVHGWQDFIRTSGTDLKQLGAAMLDPSGPISIFIELISAATGIPKRVLMGSERGELASSQDAREWAARVKERQDHYAEPVIVRPLIDRLIEFGLLPRPQRGEYEVDWPDMTGPNAEERAALADKLASAEAKHAQAEMIGQPTLTKNELRDVMGFAAIDVIEQEYPGEDLGLDEPEEPILPGQPGNPQRPTGDGRPGGGTTGERRPAAAGADAEAAPAVSAVALPTLVRSVNAASDQIFRAATADRLASALFDLTIRTAARFGLAETDPVTQATRQFMADYGGERVRDINETTREKLTRELTAGMRANESWQLLAARVRRVFREIAAGHAKTIAMTEVNRAINVGTLEGMRQAGVQYKRWYTMRDGRVRPEHAFMEGQTVLVGNPFTAEGGYQAQYPGGFGIPSLDINERCIVVAAERLPAAFAAAAAGQAEEIIRRRAVHERRYLAGVRSALRNQAQAVLRELEAG